MGKSSAANASSEEVKKRGNFFKECKAELDKVVKPTFGETKQATIVTIIILVFVALVLCVYDFVFGGMMRAIVG